VDAVEILFSEMGLDPDVPVVIYTGKGSHSKKGDGLEQTHVAYCFARYGHRKVYLLDGGLEGWIEKGGPISQDYAKVKKSSYNANDCSDKFAISMNELKRIKDNDNTVLLDARPFSVYSGQGPWKKAGHIPGAISLPWTELYDEDNPRKLKPVSDIRKILGDRGITPGKTIVCSCGTSREATSVFWVLKWVLDYPDVKIYEGSFTEWVAYPENPTVVGPDPY
jgi:thiosulfate/3-mercaptopyruvate sulfurtransferase